MWRRVQVVAMQIHHSNSILKKYIAKPIALIVFLTLLTLSGCGSPPTSDRIVTPTSPTSSPVTEQPQSPQTTTVTIYTADAQCQELVPQTVTVSAAQPIEDAVGEIIRKAGTVDFAIVGYRVNVDANTGVATVDLRLDPDSRREFVSLSSCENFSLFGSLEKTLTTNPQWQIDTVRFTERGEEIET